MVAVEDGSTVCCGFGSAGLSGWSRLGQDRGRWRMLVGGVVRKEEKIDDGRDDQRVAV